MLSLFKNGRWSHDLTRGFTLLRIRIALIPKQAAFEAERIRLVYRLTRIDKKLFHLYRLLGQQAVDCLNGPLISGEELERLYQQIQLMREDQQKVITEMEELRSVIAFGANS